MSEAPQNLPQEAADLRALLASREAEIIGFKAELRSRDLLIEQLKHQLAACAAIDLDQPPKPLIN